MSQSGMVVNLEQLERFVDSLNRLNGALADSTNNMTSNFARLGAGWRDEKYEQFASQWDSAMHAIDNYIQDCNGYVQYLRRKTEDIRDYLG